MTPTEPYLGLRGSSMRTAIALVAGLCFVAFGMGQGDLGGLLVADGFRHQFPKLDFMSPLNGPDVSVRIGLTVAVWNLGCFFSAMVTIFSGPIMGRKNTIVLGLIILAIGKILQSTASTRGQLIAGRFIAGFGNGFNTASVPSWQAECTKAHRRGTMLMISSGACVAGGIALSYWIDFGFSWLSDGGISWRIPTAFQIAPAFLAFVLILFLPESPRYLIMCGKEEEAFRVLSALSDGLKTDDPEIREEFLQIKDAILEMSSGGFRTLFSQGEYRYFHRTVLAFILQLMQQFCGVNLFTQYLAVMFRFESHYSPWLSRLLAGCSATTLFAASFITVIGIDRFWGRRSLAMFGAGGMCISLIVTTVMRYIDSEPAHHVQAVLMFVYSAFFAIGWQGTSWLWAVELTPLATRGPANALSTAANWFANFVVVLISPILLTYVGWKTYIVYAVITAVMVPVIYFLCPETGCRSLEEVDLLFHQASLSKNPWFEVVRIAREEPLWYGKDGETAFSYEDSDWHHHLVNRRRSTDADSQTRRSSFGRDSPKLYDADGEKSGL